jgi:hypothetical protein
MPLCTAGKCSYLYSGPPKAALYGAGNHGTQLSRVASGTRLGAYACRRPIGRTGADVQLAGLNPSSLQATVSGGRLFTANAPPPSAAA